MDLSRVEELIQIVKEARVSELTLREKGGAITVKKGVGPVHAPPSARHAAPKPREEPKPEVDTRLVIIAPMVGIFHAGGHGVEVDSAIRAGSVVGAIESMKLMNEVVAEVTGKVTEILVDDGQPVEYGQILFYLEPLEGE